MHALEGESQKQRNERVLELWRQLDPQGAQELDLKGLKKGFRRIDHPMKNADDMLRDIIEIVDVNRDGKIQFEEFRVFVEAAERQLLFLFRSIDHDHDGRLNKDELRAAFQHSGLAVPARRLTGFFDEIDLNHDGYITFDEWRNFLLFVPTRGGDSPLEAALSYYASTVVLNAEGDSMVSDETLEGLGTTGFLFQALFGSILKLAKPVVEVEPTEEVEQEDTKDKKDTRKEKEEPKRMAVVDEPIQPPVPSKPKPPAPPPPPLPPDVQKEREAEEQKEDEEEEEVPKKLKLTHYLPHPGYFLAGALAGGISRTATAPFDRLKVYLLVNTKAEIPAAVAAASSASASNGAKLASAVKPARPIREAIVSLYKSGGPKTFFAGNGLNVVKIMPETAIKFGSYEAAKRAFSTLEGHGDPTHISSYSKFVAGGVAGMIAQFFVYPLDTLKFRLQCETVHGGPTGNALLIQTARKMYATGGARAAYRGVTMGLIGMFPYSAIDMGTFELLKKTFTRYKARYYGIHEEDAAPGNVVTGIIGATSGAFGASVVYPLNVLRTRLQTQGTVMHPPTYTGIWDVATRTLANEGVRGLYKGLTPNLLKVAPALSITWVVYENSKKALGLP